MVDALRLEAFAHHMGRRGQARADITTRVGAGRQPIPLQPPYGIIGIERTYGVGNRCQWCVFHLDELRCSTRGGAIDGHHQSEYIAEITRAAPNRDEHRPVLVDETGTQLAGDIGGREYAHHAIDRLCC